MIDWSRIDTVLLDMDGTLLDLHYDNTVWNERLPVHYSTHHGIDAAEANERLMAHMRRTYGTLEFYCLTTWSEFSGIDIMAPHRDVVELIGWRPNAREFTQRARASGALVALATNADRRSVDIKDQYSQILSELDTSVSAHDPNIRAPKESVHFWEALQKHLAFDPARALFVDDNASVLEAAVEFGIGQCLTIAQPDSARPRRDDLAHPSVEDFAQIFPPDG